MEAIEQGLLAIVNLSRLALEAVSVLCVLLGFIATLRLFLRYRQQVYDVLFLKTRLCFGSWLAMALEFQLGADILATTVAPSFEALGKLGAIAVIRTFLNYFLNQELEAEADRQAKRKQPFEGGASET
ncbi:hypothetical protein CKA32_002706 [Geitlerinema sp. FC II]|nr:DUF1622 domain-containing protein [Geitlerinema sp. CS-897]PPT06160.1 hypothetical protein CKA32_002706 [Geitlerinema sp. FC II]